MSSEKNSAKFQEKKKKPSEELEKKIISEKKEIKKIKQIDLNKFQEFFFQSQSKAPVLQKIEQVQEIATLEREVASAPKQTNFKEEGFKYNASKEENQETKYSADKNPLGPARVDTQKLGRDNPLIKTQETQFMNAVPTIDSPFMEKYEIAKRDDVQKLGKENPFEQKFSEVKRVKYEPLH